MASIVIYTFLFTWFGEGKDVWLVNAFISDLKQDKPSKEYENLDLYKKIKSKYKVVGLGGATHLGGKDSKNVHFL